MVNATDIVELELKSKRFSLAMRKKEAIAVPEPPQVLSFRRESRDVFLVEGVEGVVGLGVTASHIDAPLAVTFWSTSCRRYSHAAESLLIETFGSFICKQQKRHQQASASQQYLRLEALAHE